MHVATDGPERWCVREDSARIRTTIVTTNPLYTGPLYEIYLEGSARPIYICTAPTKNGAVIVGVGGEFW